ncbi:hypothetical protein [Halovivax cerinus]|uniref:Transposase n=1 Tax=Halovivax cerinus TaxID=1487865 RepID=A0ABD5NTF7_9EURY|nr:hypothetical protein [Halovivax cerinus]
MLERALYWFGYAFAHLLFVRARTPESVVRRLRLAYRLVGVRIVETPRVDGTERTVFLCPYRNLAAGRWGSKWLCHEKLDRVDDGYVTFLRRHRDIEYDRPRSCANLAYCEASAHCYSDVSATGSAASDDRVAGNVASDDGIAGNVASDESPVGSAASVANAEGTVGGRDG